MMLKSAIDTYMKEAMLTRRERILSRDQRRLRTVLRTGFMSQENALAFELDKVQIEQRVFREAEPPGGFNAFDFLTLWATVTGRTREAMAGAMQAAMNNSFLRGSQVGASELIIEASFDLQHPRATAYLQDRGAQLITRIDETTRNEVRRILVSGVNEGKSYGAMKTELRAKFAQFHTPQPQLHIPDRATLIAVQETGEAYEAGNMAIAQEARDLGLQMQKSCLTAEDGRVDPICDDNEAAGWIGLEQSYPSGHQRPLFHVACRCVQLTRRIT